LEREDIHEPDFDDVGDLAVGLYSEVAGASWGIGIG
jgi:hypothetical protein